MCCSSTLLQNSLTILEGQEFKDTVQNTDSHCQSQEIGVGLQQCLLSGGHDSGQTSGVEFDDGVIVLDIPRYQEISTYMVPMEDCQSQHF